jgi:hypothetical protein
MRSRHASVVTPPKDAIAAGAAAAQERARSEREALQLAVRYYATRQHQADPKTVLKQYELLRAEVIASLQVQQQILSFGVASIALLAGAASAGRDEGFNSDILVLYLPLVAYLALTVWFSEVMRMFRAGGFLMVLERRLDAIHRDGGLTWEAHVATGRLKHPTLKPYLGLLDPDQLRLLAVTALFLTLAVASIVLGTPTASTGKVVFAWIAFGVAVVVLGMLYHLRVEQLEDLLEVDPELRLSDRIRRRLRWRTRSMD